MMRRQNARLIFLLLFVLVVSQVALAQEAPLGGFDDYVNKALRDWEVPGVAIAVVNDDRIVPAKGYGVRKLGDPAPVKVSVEMVGGKVKAVVPGQPVCDLVVLAPTRFRIAGAPDCFFVQFRMCAGKPESLTLVQGAGLSFVLTPKP